MSLYLESPPSKLRDSGKSLRSPDRLGLSSGKAGSSGQNLFSLPVRGLVSSKGRSDSSIEEEFSRLDILGEGRLTLKSIKMALELQGVEMEDYSIRKWLRESDREEKGYVDLEDYKAIYSPLSPSRKYDGKEFGNSIKLYNSANSVGKTNFSASLSLSPQKDSSKISTRSAPVFIERESQRQRLLKDAFAKYDVDGDGFITVEDMRVSLGEQKCTDREIMAWIRKRDSSGQGAVSFADFSKHYNGQTTSRTTPSGAAPPSMSSHPITGSFRVRADDNDEEEDSRLLRPDMLRRAQTLTYNTKSDLPDLISSANRERLQGRERDRLQLLRQAFANYDLDGDGFVSKQDMQLAVGGLQSSAAEIDAWIKRRDSSGKGAVSFEDFVQHYN